MSKHVFTGFGFGPIQGGLFVSEAFASGNFCRIVLAEIDQALVDAVRAGNGSYFVNVAKNDGIDTVKIDNVEIFNPQKPDDKNALIEALSQSTEIVTSLPSVSFYGAGGDSSVAGLIAQGISESTAAGTIIYTAENNNHAAEALEKEVAPRFARPCAHRLQYLNTVIGKMSRVVTDPAEIAKMNLAPIADGIDRAFLIEEFNRIMVTGCRLEGFQPGIEVFAEKDDLIPFEEAKLYGHNAIHALLAYLGAAKGYSKMTELAGDKAIMKIASDAFIKESGDALIKKYSSPGDSLFTEPGYRDFAEDLLIRITNPYLEDTIARAGRDVVRKLGPADRIFGTMTTALTQGVEPGNMALGAMAGIAGLFNPIWESELPDGLETTDWRQLNDSDIANIVNWLLGQEKNEYTVKLIELTLRAKPRLIELLGR